MEARTASTGPVGDGGRLAARLLVSWVAPLAILVLTLALDAHYALILGGSLLGAALLGAYRAGFREGDVTGRIRQSQEHQRVAAALLEASGLGDELLGAGVR